MKLVSVAEMRAIEKEADESGWTYAQMMDRAGRELAEIIQAYFGYAENRFAVALVGPGNNGGDALVALTALACQGWKTAAYLTRARGTDDGVFKAFVEAGGVVGAFEKDADFVQLDQWLDESCVLVDGVLGTGVQLPLREDIAGLLAHVRDFPNSPPVVAVDCPSGVDCDSGAAGACIPAEVTVCMAAIKQGLLKFPAYDSCGEFQVVPIGLPEGLGSWDAIARQVIDEAFVMAALPVRSDDSHKGVFGTAVITAGSANYPGAALLASKAALRTGAGLVTVAAPAPLQGLLAGQVPEATWILLSHQGGCISGDAAAVLKAGLEKADVLLLGPGFGLEDCTVDFMRRLLAGGSVPSRGRMGFINQTGEPGQPSQTGAHAGDEKGLPGLVVDADGLKILARIPDWSKKLPAPAVLTPHPGEMAVLCGWDKNKIQDDRIGAAEYFAREWGHVVVLKGAFTVVAAPDGRTGVIPVASSALAHAGSGDVLAGIIAGLRAQGVAAFEAAAAGAWIHAHAGLAAEERLGHPASVIAGELISSLPEVLGWVWRR